MEHFGCGGGVFSSCVSTRQVELESEQKRRIAAEDFAGTMMAHPQELSHQYFFTSSSFSQQAPLLQAQAGHGVMMGLGGGGTAPSVHHAETRTGMLMDTSTAVQGHISDGMSEAELWYVCHRPW